MRCYGHGHPGAREREATLVPERRRDAGAPFSTPAARNRCGVLADPLR
ncbi:MAG: hypothetical protein JWQ92_1956 [Amnibacterium sp.]|nr:hypothetical protein [Amnibacterium sp.]